MTAKLSIICSKQSNGTYFAMCPELKGCFTQGDTYEEAISNIEELAEVIIKEEFSPDTVKDILFSENKIGAEQFDYTKWRKDNLFTDVTIEELSKKAMEYRQVINI